MSSSEYPSAFLIETHSSCVCILGVAKLVEVQGATWAACVAKA